MTKNSGNVMRLAAVLLCCIVTTSASGEWRAIGNVTHVSKLPNGVEISAGSAKALITIVNDSTVSVRVAPGGVFSKEPSWAVDPEFKQMPPAVSVRENADTVSLEFPGGRVQITKTPL